MAKLEKITERPRRFMTILDNCKQPFSPHVNYLLCILHYHSFQPKLKDFVFALKRIKPYLRKTHEK